MLRNVYANTCTLPTENLLEDRGGGGDPSVTSRCGSLRPSIYADVRYIDDVTKADPTKQPAWKKMRSRHAPALYRSINPIQSVAGTAMRPMC